MTYVMAYLFVSVVVSPLVGAFIRYGGSDA